MATIAELQTKLTVDNAQFKRGIEESQNRVRSFGESSAASMVKIGAAVVALGYVLKTAFSTLNETTKKFSDLADTSTRIGVGVESLQKLHYVATQSGISVELMDRALGKMEKTLGQAEAGSTQAALAFTSIGLSISALSKMNPAEQYTVISDAIKGLGSVAQQQAASWGIFGRAGGEQLSALKDDVRGLLAEADRLGVALSGPQVRAIKQYGDQVDKVSTLWEVFKAQLVSVVAGPLAQMIQDFGANIEAMGGMGVAAQNFGNIIMPILKDLSHLAEAATLPFKGLEYSIKAAALAAAKLAEIRAKSKLSDVKDLGEVDPEGLKKANNEYINATAYLKAMKEEIKQVTIARIEDNKAQLKPLADLSGGGTGLNTAMDALGIQTQITDQLNLQETAAERAIRAEQKKYDNQKDITSEMRKQVDAAHSLYEEVRSAQTFEKELRKDLDNIEASIRQDQQETAAGIPHAGDRDPTLDQYAPNKDRQGRLLADSSDSQRTLALKADYNNKINDRLEQIKHGELLKSIDLVQFKQAEDDKKALDQLEQRLIEIREALKGGGNGANPPGISNTSEGDKANAYANASDSDIQYGDGPKVPYTRGGKRIGDQTPMQNNKPIQVDVNISASEDFVAKVVQSQENANMIENVSKAQMAQEMRGL